MKKLSIGLSIGLCVLFAISAKAQSKTLTRNGTELIVYTTAQQDSIAAINAALKVDKVAGMGLSQNSYTSAEKALVAAFVPAVPVVPFDPTTLNPQFSQKVDKVAGMGLSANNYINDDVAFLHGLTAGIGSAYVAHLSFSGNTALGADNTYATFDGNQSLGFVKSANTDSWHGVVGYGSTRNFTIAQSSTADLNPASTYINRLILSSSDGSLTIPALASVSGGSISVDPNGKFIIGNSSTPSNLTLNDILRNGASTDLDIHLGNINQYGQLLHHGPNGDADTVIRLMAGSGSGALIGTSNGGGMFFNGSFGVGRIPTGNSEPSLSIVGNIYMDHFIGNGTNLVRYLNDGTLSNSVGDITVMNLTLNGLLRNMAMADGANGTLMVDGSGSVYKRPVTAVSNPATQDDDFSDVTAGETSFTLSTFIIGDPVFYLNGVKISKQFVTKSGRGGTTVIYSGASVSGTDKVSIVYTTSIAGN